MMMRGHVTGAVVVLLCVALSACGNGTSESALVHVDRVVITRADVDHWIRAFAGRLVTPDPPKYTECIRHLRLVEAAGPKKSGPVDQAALKAICQGQYASLRERALGYLISGQWLLGEASARGLGPSEHEVSARYQQKVKTSFPGGQREFQEFQTSSGHTLADIMLETRIEMANSRLLHTALADVPQITPSEVQVYYRLHPKRFTIPEARVVQIVVGHSMVLAVKVKHEVEAGKSIARYGEERTINSNPLDRPGYFAGNAIEKIVFKGRPHTLLGPLSFRKVDFDLFEVKRVIPAKLRPLEEVHADIETQLSNEAHRRALALFVRAWRLRWRAKTACLNGGVLSKCARYPAVQALAHEDRYSFN